MSVYHYDQHPLGEARDPRGASPKYPVKGDESWPEEEEAINIDGQMVAAQMMGEIAIHEKAAKPERYTITGKIDLTKY